MKAVILAVSLSLLSFSVASAQLTKVTVGYSLIAAGSIPGWVAKESGVFHKNGLDVQLVYIRGGTTVVMSLLSRETPISQVGGSAIVSASLRGADAVMIAGGTVTTDQWLMSRPKIKTAEQLKGGSVAIDRFGGTSDLLTRIALKRLGLTPVKDVALVQIGSVPDRLSALEKEKVQAAILVSPDSFIAQKKGFYTLLSVSIPYQAVGVATTRTFIRENPDIAKRYVKSQIEAVPVGEDVEVRPSGNRAPHAHSALQAILPLDDIHHLVMRHAHPELRRDFDGLRLGNVICGKALSIRVAENNEYAGSQ